MTRSARSTRRLDPEKTSPLSWRHWLLSMLILLTLIPSANSVPLSSPPRVLILDETVIGGLSSQEAAAATLAIPGVAIDIVTAANWGSVPATGLGGPTGFGFDSYRALIIGDPTCNTSTSQYLAALNALNANKAVWTPVVTGNVILEGVDNAFHAPYLVGADKTLKRGIAFAVNDPTKTGFYYALSCYYDYTAPAVTPTLVPHLTGFGTFLTRNYNYICFNDAHIVATHPVFTASPPLTDAELSNWSCSTHEGFDVWPANFVVLAIALTNGAYNATDGSNGVPYILVRGEGVKVISPIELGPPIATNNLGTTHTVCATLSTNLNPYAGVAVTFTITSGPNAVTNYTTLSDANGVACFTYTGIGGVGTDYITASCLSPKDIKFISGTVSKIWVGSCLVLGCPHVDCLPDGTYSYQFCVSNFSGSPINGVVFQPMPGGMMTPGTINFNPVLNSGQGTNVSVIVTAPAGATNFCFRIGALGVEGLPPCFIPSCLALPVCCNRIITNTLTYAGSIGTTNLYNFQITIQNISADSLKYVAFASAQPCVKFVPGLVDLTLPVYGGPALVPPSGVRTFTIQVQMASPCAAPYNITMSALNSNLVACCSSKFQLPKPKCIGIVIPIDHAVYLTNTAVALRVGYVATINPCPFGTVVYYANDVAVAVADQEPWQASFTPTVAGDYKITAVSWLSTGEMETSDPVTITVLAPGPEPDQNHSHPPGLMSAGVTGSSISLNVMTISGYNYAVEYRTNINQGTWKTLQSFTGDGSLKIITDTVTNDRARYYRAVLQP